MKYFYLLFIWLSFHALHGQTPKFKKLFTEEDRHYLITKMRECLGLSANLKFSYSTTELYNSKVFHENPASLTEIEKTKKTLKGTDDDASIYVTISGLYARLNKNKEAEEYREKAISIAEKLLEQHPDSIAPYLFLAAIYHGALQPEKTIFYSKKAASLKDGYSDPLITNVSVFLTYFQCDSAKLLIEHLLKNYPDNHHVCSIIPMLYIANFAQKIANSSDINYFLNTPIDTIIATPLLDEIYQKNKNDFDVKFLYMVTRQVLLFTVAGISSVSDTTFDSDNVKFKIPIQIEEEMRVNEVFFLECLKNKNTSYHFYANKLLGSIYILKNETKKAIPYLRKAIDLKPVSNCSTTSNTNEDYYNLLGAYLILKDTAAYEKTLLEKIKRQPTIDPFSQDYTNLATLYCCQNKIELAKQYFQKAKKIDDEFLQLEAGESSNAIVGLGYCDFVLSDLKGANDYVNQLQTKQQTMGVICLICLHSNTARRY